MEILLKGKQINLRLLTKHDAADIAKYAHDRSVNRFTLVPYRLAIVERVSPRFILWYTSAGPGFDDEGIASSFATSVSPFPGGTRRV